MKKYLLIIILCLPMLADAQVRFLFVPELYGRSLDGIYNARLINPGGRQTATLTITVSERKNGTVFSTTTSEFDLPPGTSTIPMQAVRAARMQFFETKISAITRQQRYFPQGLYEYCFTLVSKNSTNQPLSEECFEYELTPFAELNLVSPYDKDKVCELRPLLTWQPLLPAIAGSAYQLVLAEIKENQNATEALNYNLPVINQTNIITNILSYPPTAKELVKGKRYTWQVTAYKDQTILSRSEIWEFTAGCDVPERKMLSDDGYRSIDDLTKGNFYIANGYIKFTVINAYNEQTLKYQIVALDVPDRKIKGLPKIKLEHGNNKVLIDLKGNSSLETDAFYVLQMRLPDGTEKKLRFMYTPEDDKK